VRTRLDELKRQEVARLRMLIKAKMDSVQGKNTKSNRVSWAPVQYKLDKIKVTLSLLSVVVLFDLAYGQQMGIFIGN